MTVLTERDEQTFERRCVHCSSDEPAQDCPGAVYLGALGRLKGSEALMLARKVEPFYWSDADVIHIHLCRDCTAALRLDNRQAPLRTTTSH